MKTLSLLVKPAAGLCNINCKYCFYRQEVKDRRESIMTNETADLLIKKIFAFSPDSVSIVFQGGEPTLAGLPFFERFTNEIKKHNTKKIPFSYGMQTNGILINDNWAKFLKSNNFLTGVSLDGARKTNDRYRADNFGQSILPQTLGAINTLKKHGAEFNILSVVDNKNAADIKKNYEYFKKHGFKFLQFIPYIDEGYDISLECDNYLEFLKTLFDLWYDDYVRGNFISIRNFDNYIGILLGYPPENCAMSGFCGNYFVINWDGEIYPCDFYCKTDDKIADLRDDKPFENNPAHQKFADESKKIHAYCKSCKYYTLCRGGCKRDRIDDFTKNKYCRAYYGFFEYNAERMKKIAHSIRQRQY